MPDILFPSDNVDGVPLLDLDRQVIDVEIPVRAWGSVSRKRWQPGGLHFYVDDYRFSRLWSRPRQIVDVAPLFACEPNYTLGDQQPRCMAIASIYKKRYLARYWQSLGLPTMVDLFVPERWRLENLLGVPRGWSAYSTRGAETLVDELPELLELARERAGRDRITFLVIGGARKVGAWCRDHAAAGVVHCDYGAAKFIHGRNARRAS